MVLFFSHAKLAIHNFSNQNQVIQQYSSTAGPPLFCFRKQYPAGGREQGVRSHLITKHLISLLGMVFSKCHQTTYPIPSPGKKASFATTGVAHVVKWLKHWTVGLQVPGSNPTMEQGYFLSLQGTSPTSKLRRRATFVSFGGDIKLSAGGTWFAGACTCLIVHASL